MTQSPPSAEGETKAGFVALIGAPNVGKSTLVNTLVGAKVAIVSAKVQTTRTRLVGVVMADKSQILLVDTPGIFSPRRRLDRAMVKAAWDGAGDADITALLIDAKRGIDDGTADIITALADQPGQKLAIINKIDLVARPKLLDLAANLDGRLGWDQIFMVSALKHDGVADLTAYLAGQMPEGPWLFPEDQLTDVTQRMMARELTREKIYHQLHQELPYALNVDVEGWTEQAGGAVRIDQIIYVERDSQKGIVIGKGGARLKALGEAARLDMEAAFGRTVHLFLHVKVDQSWADRRSTFTDLGLDWAP